MKEYPCSSLCVPYREYHIHAGKTEMKDSLKKQFPGEEKAIDEFMRLMKVAMRRKLYADVTIKSAYFFFLKRTQTP